MKELTVGILAHVDAGKTTLSEALLYISGEIRRAGRVDKGDSFLDATLVERKRGITVFSKQAVIETPDTRFVLLDTPGHADFSAETERTLSVLDYAVLVISVSDGIQSHTETLWRMLADHKIPTFIFVNKTDIALRSKESLMTELKKLSAACCDFTCGNGYGDDPASADKVRAGSGRKPEGRGVSHPGAGGKPESSGVNMTGTAGSAGAISEALTDSVTLADPGLLEKALTGYLKTEDIARSVKERKIFPCYFGSALKMTGVSELLRGLSVYTLSGEKRNEFSARVYKIARGDQGERLTFLKITGGALHVKDPVTEGRGTDALTEKVDQIRLFSGAKYRQIEEAGQGLCCAVTGLSGTYAGQGLGTESHDEAVTSEPFMTCSVFSEEADSHRIFNDLKIMAEEDTELHPVWNRETGEISVRIMGNIQKEILSEIFPGRFGYGISFGPARILCRETITKTEEGMGHFEPLRHYAEVHLILEPGDPGSGLVFTSQVPEDSLAGNWQRLILSSLEEGDCPGVLTGAPVTDMKIVLAAGRAHIKHTSGGDFREAASRALRAGLMKARRDGAAVLLEPRADFILKIPENQLGLIMTELGRGGVSFDEPEKEDGLAVLKGQGPARILTELQNNILSATSGRGKLTMKFTGYEEAADTEELIRLSGYDPDADAEHPSSSVFVNHGGETGIVPWEEAEKKMHIPSVLKERRDERKERAGAYRERLENDEELLAIFERTYGKIKERTGRPASGRKSGSAGAANTDVSARVRKISAGLKTQGYTDEPEVIFIDGYNLIRQDRELNELAKLDLGASRQKLIDVLCNYSGFTGSEITVVFDAYRVSDSGERESRVHGVTVVYTAADETADTYIERVTRVNRRRHTRVVTSDAMVQQISLGHGAVRTSSREFLEEIKGCEEAIREVLSQEY